MKKLLWFMGILLGLTTNSFCTGIVFNEISYHPVDDAPIEFIELYNASDQAVDLTGYHFSRGIEYLFPQGTKINANEYLLVVQDVNQSAWRNIKKVGPFAGTLSNNGETLELLDNENQTVDSLKYGDSSPWPRAADGEGSTLERISPDLPSTDYHSWRASESTGGTPGKINSVINIPPYPMIQSLRFQPQHPKPGDTVDVIATLDGVELIDQVICHYETQTISTQGTHLTKNMTLGEQTETEETFLSTLPAMPTQTLLRVSIEVVLTDGKHVRLPHSADPKPFESCFVYNNEIPSKLPIMWLFPSRVSQIPSPFRSIPGIAVKEPTSEFVEMYDGLNIIPARNGHKIHFNKDEEFQGDRTINLSLESPQEGTTAGGQSPHVEHISYQLFRDFGVISERCEWYRVIEPNGQYQRIAIQQPNERFLEMNGLDSDGNLYKIAYNEPGGFSKKTNIYDGHADYDELFKYVNKNNKTNLSDSLHKYLDVEEIMGYDLAMFLLSHWDGIMNNIFIYHDPAPNGKWKIFPWDVDKCFGYTDSNPMYWEMPIDFFITGKCTSPELTSRNLIGPFCRPIHLDKELHQEFKNRVAQALDGLFSQKRVNGMIDAIQAVLLEDLDSLESYTQKKRPERRTQITKSYDTMKKFMTLRHQFLRTQIPSAFTVSRTAPVDTYAAGDTLSGIQITINPSAGKIISPVIIETLPTGFTPQNITVTTGKAVLSGNIITWTVANLDKTAVMSYDLLAPVQNVPLSAKITGIAKEGDAEYAIGETTLQISKKVIGLKPEWVIGSAGQWIVINGILNCYADSGADPKHIWVKKDFGTEDYSVKADVRMVDWLDGDLARSGVAVRVNPDDRETALNFLFHDNNQTLGLLNDLTAWGTAGQYSWKTGEWYTMKLEAKGSLLTGSITKTGSNEIPFIITWDDDRNALRPSGYPGLTGSSMQGLTTQYDNFEVIVNGKTVFSDNFDSTPVPDWQIY